MDKSGKVQVYTGDGKGKTTAAMGQAIRALGHGQRVLVVQFLKGRPTGEIDILRGMDNVTVQRYGSSEFVCGDPTPEDMALAKEGFEKAVEAVMSGGYDLVILDEINILVNYKMLEVDQVLRLIKERPEGVELILTGRNAHPQVVDAADLVSEVRAVKHYYKEGVGARPGVEY
ncbi:MAG: cob(I)yrinic acid a,c-diamide adenosyltransferase [Planctomycetes bacterium]|nr:cob(I)yrinic acid a,c-diamide adenosyltransferase [Planctomycetota bacterium]